MKLIDHIKAKAILGLATLTDLALKAPLTGVGTSGTWPISISGSAGSAPSRVYTVGAVFQASGLALTAAAKAYIECPTAGNISKAILLTEGGTGSCVIDVWKDTYANYPPTVADTIAASAKPTISSGTKASDATLTGWTKTITAGDVIGFNIDSTSTFTKITVILEITT